MTVAGVQQIRFRVTPPQAQFIASDARYTLLSGGYGSGKSVALADKTIWRCIQNRGLAGMVLASDYGRLSRDFLPKLFERLDLYGIKFRWKRQALRGLISRTLLIGPGVLDTTLLLGSAAYPDSVKGPTLAFITIEEATLLPRLVPGKSERFWGVIISRLRALEGDGTGTPTLTVDMSGTPEGVGGWTCDEGMFERAPGDPKKLDAWMRDYRLIRASSWTNTFLPDGFVKAMVDSLDPRQAREKIDGFPAAGVGGAAYYSFEIARNVRRVQYDRFKGPVIVGWDINVNPMTCSLMQMHKGVIGVFDEISLHDSNTPAMCFALIRRLNALGLKPQDAIVYPDASGRARTSMGVSDFRIMRAAGFVTLKFELSGNPRVRDRLAALNGALYHARLIIDPGCRGIIRDMLNVAVDDDGHIKKTNPDLTHFSDGLGYAVEKLIPIRGAASVGFV